MKKLIIFTSTILLVSGCAILSELTALTKCEFSFHSAQDPSVCGIDISSRRSYSDFSFLDGQIIASNILKGTLPLCHHSKCGGNKSWSSYRSGKLH